MYQCYGIKGYTHKEKLRLKTKYSYLQDRKNIHIDRCGNTSGQECHTKEGIKESKIHEFMHRDTINVEHEMHGDTSNKWGH